MTRRWTLTRSRRQVRLDVEAIDEPTLTLSVVWPRPRPWVPALVWLCLPTALVSAVVLLARPSASAEWLAVAALVAVPVTAAVALWAVGWMRHGAMRWRVRRLLRGPALSTASPLAVPTEAREVADDPGPLVARMPGAVRPAEWLSADEVERLADARPARRALSDLRHARRTVVRKTARRRARAPLPDGFTEWRPRTS